MSSLRVLLLLLCALPVAGGAAEAPPAQCGAPVPEAVFAPTESRTLDRQEVDALKRLFRGLTDRWSGQAVERVCMQHGPAKLRRYDAEFKLSRDGDGLRLAGDYVQIPSGAKRRFLRRLLLVSDTLRVDHPGKAGEVELLAADASGLSYMQRYRTLHTWPAADGGEGTGGAVAAVAGSTNLTTEEEEDAEPDPPPERRSITRAERFTLQTMGSRRLVLIQDYYVQGAYTGSMRWELTRR